MKERLLFANADARVAQKFRDYFSAAGYQVETATDGLDCLMRLRRERPNLLILDRDLLWGGSDGVLACLREEIDIGRCPVVLLAAVLSVAGLWRMKAPPVVRCLSKPPHLPALHVCIDSLMSRSH